MKNNISGLFLCVNPQLRRFDQRLYSQLNLYANIKIWSYDQNPDQPCCIETALSSLHQHIQLQSQPIHLLGHGLSGSLGLLYARMYPHCVKSLTLLSVGANPAISWHAHYYEMRNLLPCRREMILMQMGYMLFGQQNSVPIMKVVNLLATVLDAELTPHSLAKHNGFSPGGIHSPLLICNGDYDAIVDQKAHENWHQWLKPGDQLWRCPEGRHFFQHDFPRLTSQRIISFWQHTSSSRIAPFPAESMI